jgi:hypothetical protein
VHLAIAVGGTEQVNALAKRAEMAGILVSAPRTTGDRGSSHVNRVWSLTQWPRQSQFLQSRIQNQDWFYYGIAVGGTEQVNALAKRAEMAGILVSAPRTTGDGYFM